jgi:hypothetical protein
VFPDQGLSLAQARARREVEEANRQAAAFAQEDHTPDVRRALASRIAESLEGGRAAILPVERRKELVSAAGRLGIRPFEANLVIALVQDAARRGEPTVGGGPLDRMLGVIPQPTSDARRAERWAWFRAGLATMALGGLLMTFLVHWILGGGAK